MRKITNRLLLILTIFSVALIAVMSLITQYIILGDVEREQEALQSNIESQILKDLETMDRAHRIFRENETENMENGLRHLREYYEENPDIYSWDLDYVTDRYNMDFYILNEAGQVVITTHEPLRNVDFNDYNKEFVNLIKERIQTDTFYYDGLEVSMVTKELRMYGYLATSDHKYLLEFGIRFEDTEIAKGFNYGYTVDSLVGNYQDLKDLHVFTSSGFSLSKNSAHFTYEDLNPILQTAFLKVSETGQDLSVIEELDNGVKRIHRFIPYRSKEAPGNATDRVVYAEYTNLTEQMKKKQSIKQFLLMILIAIVISAVLLFIILRVLKSTFRQATTDTLTGAYNRSSYLHYIDTLIHHRKEYPIGLMVVDLDNFKQVNDDYGHATGDKALQETTKILTEVVGSKGYIARFGGDEFVIVYKKSSPEILQKYAESILIVMRNKSLASDELYWSILKMSIGYTIQKDSLEQESNLFERADQAMYLSKKNGKDTWTYLEPDADVT